MRIGMQLADGPRLGWSDGFLVVTITTLLALSLLLQASPPAALDLDAALGTARDTVETLAARALEALQDLPEILP